MNVNLTQREYKWTHLVNYGNYGDPLELPQRLLGVPGKEKIGKENKGK